MVINISKQSILCLVETVKKQVKFYCSFIYASISAKERRELWKELLLQKTVCNSFPWILMGDYNVTLKVNEHSNSGSAMTAEMNEFKECVNSLEVEDMNSDADYCKTH